MFELRDLLETAGMSGRMYIDDRKWGEIYVMDIRLIRVTCGL